MSMQDAVAAVGGFARERQPRALAVKLRAPVDQLLDAVRAFFHQDVRRIHVHDAVAGADRVLQVQADLIFVAQGNGNSALRILRG